MSSPEETDSFLREDGETEAPPNGHITTPTFSSSENVSDNQQQNGQVVSQRTPSGHLINLLENPNKYPDAMDRAETTSLDGKGLLTTSQTNVTNKHSLLSNKRSLSIGDWPIKGRKHGQTHICLDGTEKFLIGRADGSLSVAGFGLTQRHVRITEVAPTNSSIVDADEPGWKVSIDLFSSQKKHGKTKEYKKLPRRIRSYYKAQNELITAFEEIQLEVDDALANTEMLVKQRQRIALLAKVTLVVNLLLLVAKGVAVALSGSMSIISSLVDSAVDLVSGIIIWWTSRAVRKRKPYVYPQGRTRLEPVGIVIVSVVMSLAALQLIVESVQKIVNFSQGSASIPVVDLWTFIITGSTIVVKLVLYFVCRCCAGNSPSVSALSQDHRNDVVSNTGAIICGYLGSIGFMNKTQERGVVYIDPVGAILISFYILYNWWKTGYEQIKLLTGHTAKPDFLSKLTWICLNHHHKIQFIDTVRAFHFGTNFLVECDVVLPHDMKLKEAHDIGEDLQQKLEKLPEVERAFVHLDYETSHDPNTEHKIV